MRNIVIGMAMASTMLASPALARDSQWYVQVEGGPMLVEDLDFDVNGVEDQLTQDYDAGYDFGGLVGYDFGPVRIEAEASYLPGRCRYAPRSRRPVPGERLRQLAELHGQRPGRLRSR